MKTLKTVLAFVTFPLLAVAVPACSSDSGASADDDATGDDQNVTAASGKDFFVSGGKATDARQITVKLANRATTACPDGGTKASCVVDPLRIDYDALELSEASRIKLATAFASG